MVKIRVLFIFEMLGKPAEHLTNSLEKMIDQLGVNKGLEVVRKIVHEPKLVDDKSEAKSKIEELEREQFIKQGLYSTFSEVEIVTEDLNLVMAIVLNMLPAHVEILEPTELVLTNSNMSGLMSELTVKMHKYDEVTKVLMLEKEHLIAKLKQAEEKINNFEGEVKGEKVKEKVVEKVEEKVEDKNESIEKPVEGDNTEKVNEVDIGVEGEKDK
jgi:hypothetical protein